MKKLTKIQIIGIALSLIGLLSLVYFLFQNYNNANIIPDEDVFPSYLENYTYVNINIPCSNEITVINEDKWKLYPIACWQNKTYILIPQNEINDNITLNYGTNRTCNSKNTSCSS